MKRLPLLLIPLVLAACGGKGATGAQPSGPRIAAYRPAAAATLPACAHARAAIPYPRDFPAAVPLPVGSRITGGYHELQGKVLQGFTPVHAFSPLLQAFLKALPKHGFTRRDSDAEPPREAEGQYFGHGYALNWKLHNIPKCSGVLTLTLYAQRSKSKG
jgi:hypothetical protein